MVKKLLVIISFFFIASCQTTGDMFSPLIQPGSQADLEANVGDHILFETNSAQLSPEARRILDSQAKWLKQYNDVNVIIEGHCDERGTREYNLALGARRASAVKNYLEASGVTVGRVSTISFGKDNPPVLGSGPEIWAQNRRASTVLNN